MHTTKFTLILPFLQQYTPKCNLKSGRSFSSRFNGSQRKRLIWRIRIVASNPSGSYPDRMAEFALAAFPLWIGLERSHFEVVLDETIV